ncbi:MAG: SDR family oxidoreductase [Planctomycetota bacterium]|jgi:gluconate 5-dehydrogenase|nr:SDR family oxidoreductase [Planctomycetota bacterium]
MFDLSGKTALVTGSGRGIGLVLARGLARAGARVALNDLDGDRIAPAREELRREGHETGAAAFDVTDSAAVREGLDRLEREFAPLDILINNAGIHRRAPLAEMPVEDWRLVIDTNLTSAFLVGQRAARGMIARGGGKIINICSLNCELPRPGIGNYSAAKGGLVLLTRSMTVEWARHNIQVNGIAPGYILTEMTRPLSEDPERNAWIVGRTPAGRWGRPEDLIGAAVFLASEASAFVNGQMIFVDGGMRVAL